MRTALAVRGARLPRHGFTLLEMIVVLAILGLIFGVSALAFTSLKTPRESDITRELRRARSEAIHTGRAVVIDRNRAPRTAYVLFLPDGRAIGPGADPLTGAPLDAPK
jgi:prepilin-type N-terminal cleavage/methylation domain-containing protein